MSDEPLRFDDPRKAPFAPLRFRGALPHLEKDGGVYFVTFRAWDAVDRTPLAEDEEPSPEIIADRSEPPLTRGACVLARPDVATIVAGSMQHFDDVRYRLVAWVVMPNHVHAVVAPSPPHTLSRILHSWKSFSAKAIHKILGTSGAFWEEESFDHLIRSEAALTRFVDYVHANPVRAGLCENPGDWPFSSAHHRS